MDSNINIPLAARQIVRASRSGSIATTDRETKAPYVSFCSFAHDYRGHPIFLFSDLSDHTKNLMENNKVSFLCEQASHLTNPQTGPRVSLCGKIVKTTSESDKEIYLTAHSPAKMYASFGDFNFYKLQVEKAHYIGGFGKAHWVESHSFFSESTVAQDFQINAAKHTSIITDEFPEFVVYCATKLLKQRGKNWKILRVDSDGIDLKLSARVVRYPFDKEVKNIEDLRNLISQILP